MAVDRRSSRNDDWTRGPAMTLAAGVLVGASLVGLAWALLGREANPTLTPGPASVSAEEVSVRPGVLGDRGDLSWPFDAVATPAVSVPKSSAGRRDDRGWSAVRLALRGGEPPLGPAAPTGLSVGAAGLDAPTGVLNAVGSRELAAEPAWRGRQPLWLPASQQTSDRPSPGVPGSTGGVAKRVNLNSASVEELDLLPGIGPTLAERIVEDRRQQGPFRSVDDLQRVPGIGEKTVERIRALLTVE